MNNVTTALIIGTLIVVALLFTCVSCKYSAPNSPAAAIDNRNRIEVLEKQVRDLTISQITQAEHLNKLAENQLRLAQLLEYKQKGYKWE